MEGFFLGIRRGRGQDSGEDLRKENEELKARLEKEKEDSHRGVGREVRTTKDGKSIAIELG